MAKKIITYQAFPPIPVRNMEWLAHYDGEEEKGEYGYGFAEQEAVSDLKQSFQKDEKNEIA